MSLKKILLLLVGATLILPNFFVFAQEEEAPVDAAVSEQDALNAQLQSQVEERQALEEELAKLEKEIAGYESDISKTQTEKKTLQNKIYTLQNQIKKLNLQIQQSNALIKDVGLQIVDTTASIGNTTLKIEDSRIKLVEILRLIYEEDQKGLIEILFTQDTLSSFFDNLTALEALLSRNQELLENIKELKVSLGTQKDSLDKEKGDLERLRQIQLLQKQQSQSTTQEQQTLLEKTKGKESEYQKLLTQSKEKAAQIRSRIFELIGVAKAPTFGEAYEIAKRAASATGIRPSFLLAILTQESNIGKNVGQCYLKNTQTGEGVRVSSGAIIKNVMKPMGLSGRKGDVDDFLAITKDLGRDSFSTLVSCPIASVGGYGGAMGPAQFIPTTWVSYSDELKKITGQSTADPWNIKDAFMAAALYVSDYGAKSKEYNGEWKAAMIYFSGSTNTRYRFYGDSVISITKQYEQDIKDLEQQ